MKSKIFLLIVGAVIVSIIMLSASIIENKQSTSAKAVELSEPIISDLIRIKDANGNELTCKMVKGVCNIYTKSSGITFQKKQQIPL